MPFLDTHTFQRWRAVGGAKKPRPGGHSAKRAGADSSRGVASRFVTNHGGEIRTQSRTAGSLRGDGSGGGPSSFSGGMTRSARGPGSRKPRFPDNRNRRAPQPQGSTRMTGTAKELVDCRLPNRPILEAAAAKRSETRTGWLRHDVYLCDSAADHRVQRRARCRTPDGRAASFWFHGPGGFDLLLRFSATSSPCTSTKLVSRPSGRYPACGSCSVPGFLSDR